MYLLLDNINITDLFGLLYGLLLRVFWDYIGVKDQEVGKKIKEKERMKLFVL